MGGGAFHRFYLNNTADLERFWFKSRGGDVRRPSGQFGMNESQIATVFDCTRVENSLKQQKCDEKH